MARQNYDYKEDRGGGHVVVAILLIVNILAGLTSFGLILSRHKKPAATISHTRTAERSFPHHRATATITKK